MPASAISWTSKLGLLAALLLCTLSCSSLEVKMTTSSPQVKQAFVVAGGFGTLEPIFEEGDSRALGDLAQNLPKNSYGHTTFRLADRDDATNVWAIAAPATVEWLHPRVNKFGDEISVVIDRKALKKYPDLSLGLVVLTDSANTGQRYYGHMIDSFDLEPGGFWFIKRGPKLRVSLRGDAAPLRARRR